MPSLEIIKKALKNLRKFDQSHRWEKKIDLIQIDPLFDGIRKEKEFKEMINKELVWKRKVRAEVKRLEDIGEL